MLVHPNIDPIALSLGPLKVHWYGLMYLLGFWGSWRLGVVRGRRPWVNWTRDQVSDVIFYGVLGVILGGRIGYMLFYAYTPQGQWLERIDPMTVFRVWDGGMSFHGGLLGVSVSMILYAWHQKWSVFKVSDFVSIIVPFGLFTGRIGNFINGELWGAPTSLPWGMIFQTDPERLPRHPSQLYEAALEGLATLAIMWWFGSRPRPQMASTGLFLLLYGTFRSLIEFVRVPDAQFGYLALGWVTMGQLLCLPMLLGGATLLLLAYRRPSYTAA